MLPCASSTTPCGTPRLRPWPITDHVPGLLGSDVGGAGARAAGEASMAVLTVAAAASAGTVGGAAWSLAGAVAGTAAGAVDEAALSTGAAAVRAATELADALVALAGSAAADCVERAETGVEVGTMEAAGP